MVAVQHEFEARASGSFSIPPLHGGVGAGDEPPPPPRYVPIVPRSQATSSGPSSRGRQAIPSRPPGPATRSGPPGALPTTIGLPPPPELAGLRAANGASSKNANGTTPVNPMRVDSMHVDPMRVDP